MRIFLLAMALGAAALNPASARARDSSQSGGLGPVAEEVVFSVGEHFITRSDLEVEARVVLVMGGGVGAAFASIPEETVASVIDYVINQLLIIQEVERLRVFDVSPEEVAGEYAKLAGAFAGEEEFEAFRAHLDVGADRLSSILRRNLRVQRYLESRVRLTVRVSEDEVVAFFVEDSERFGGRSLEDVREAIRGHIFRRRFEASVATLVADLRRRSDLRVLAAPIPYPASPFVHRPASVPTEEDEP